MQRYFLEIAFDGTNYFGWQIQPNHISVQGKISEILSLLFNTSINIVGCGRTDTGVHAKQFFAHFDAPVFRKNLFNSIRVMFPNDIQLIQLHKVENNAHARFDATERSYSYFLHQRKDIFKRHYSLGVDLNKLDFELINKACEIFVKEKNYTSLSRKNENLENQLSDVRVAEFIVNSNKTEAVFHIKSNRFLHNQIRRMVGALLDIGINKISINDLKNAMQKGEKLPYNTKVEAKGLFLHGIKYPYLQ